MADPADDLYALPPGRFTAARDALAKQLRKDGDRTAADAVKQLKRPTAAAWAANTVAREAPAALEELLDASDALRDAQAELLAGSGDRAALRAAVDRQRTAATAFVGSARSLASERGERLTEAALEKLRETLQAAVTDDAVRDALRSARLEREAAASVGFAAGGPAAAERPEPSAPERRKAAAEKRRRVAAERETADAALRDADRAAKLADRDAEKANRRAERAESALERARTALAAAEEDLGEARDDQSRTRAALRAAKEATAAAQSARDALD